MSVALSERTSSRRTGRARTRLGLALAGLLATTSLGLAAEPFGPQADRIAAGMDGAVSPSSSVSLEAHAAASLVPVERTDTSIALEERIAGLQGGDMAMPDEIEALKAFYGARTYEPVWVSPVGLTPAARRIGDWLATAADDGLDPARYPMARLNRVTTRRAEARAAAELRVALSVIRYADHAQAGTIDPRSVHGLIDLDPSRPDPAAVLADVAAAEDPALALDGYNPPHAGYRNLRRALIDLNAADEVPVVEVPAGRTLRRGIVDPRVSRLRERLGLLEQGDSTTQGETFDAEVEEAVRAFQAEHGLMADGIVGPRTLSVLNGGSGSRREEIIANMERWRWMPRELGHRYVHVNIPEFTVSIMEGRGAGRYEPSYTGRVVVGKPSNPTPVFSDEIEHVVVNPYWNVPYSIARGEMLPRLISNPGYYANRGYETLSSSGKPINPYAIDWRRRGVNGIRFRQTPGSGNALGSVKFLFPNEHAVYLHDTNAKSLFSRAVRAFSHGCVRLHEPFVFAEHLLAEDTDLSAASVKGAVGGLERWFNTSDHIPVHITYFTVTADEGGALDFAGDIYGFDRRVQEMMGAT